MEEQGVEAQVASDSQDSPQLGLGGGHHLSLHFSTGGHIQMAFVSELPSGSFGILTIGTPMTLGAHNFV
jgi:hypothetical protein